MASSGCLRAASGAARGRYGTLLVELRRRAGGPPTAAMRQRHVSSVTEPPLAMQPVPEDAPPRQTPPRLGEPDPVGPPTPSPKEKITGTQGDGDAFPDDVPDTTPPPDVPMPPVSPDGGSNV
ncbi:extensin [Brachypodium distachyon]|uniref:Uncharacterized protein n=1 Tax=Brachypodium distachyon TaxID=15368 RepID=A0A0Q3PA99_BRADI|nr:extensin [Brachypodium distachyon]KQJ85953.1 hypothetical protein BRADI_4g02553v3 [Brachypodium distachyon]|eukprot:XP_003579188.1 extensin [Brachypodium distachyon]